MTLTPGTRLGPYEVVGPLGAGGMGEVFKARDTRLERSVAIKILPAEFSNNAQLRLRFEREAKTISQLSHPNICALYDVGDGYLVMELLEGETLADRIAKGPLPIDQVIRIGAQIADALDRAHKAGIVHRDLKPGNVMLTKSGAKLLDFGLAKEAAGLGPRTSVVETMQKPLTEDASESAASSARRSGSRIDSMSPDATSANAQRERMTVGDERRVSPFERRRRTGGSLCRGHRRRS